MLISCWFFYLTFFLTKPVLGRHVGSHRPPSCGIDPMYGSATLNPHQLSADSQQALKAVDHLLTSLRSQKARGAGQ